MPFELPNGGAVQSSPPGDPRALLVQLELPADPAQTTARAEEFAALARAAGVRTAEPVQRIRVRAPSAATLAGTGQLKRLAERIQAQQLPLVIFDNDLRPSQERNMERLLNCRVLDRTGLILDIFSRRAHSHAGRLQVELAQLQHLSTRLQRGWSHLERQKGGIGLRGPGESQLETDRRLIGRRIEKLRADLSRLRRQRRLGLRHRRRNRVPLVALVGYTNAGKSTLFNALTEEQVPAADRLFETLDTSMRRWHLGLETPVVLADTVGFVSRLPHQIVEAFQATLEGIAQADLLLIVEDQNDPLRLESRREVQRVLEEIDAADLTQLRVLNKIDCAGAQPGATGGDDSTLAVSARTGAGLDQLARAVAARLVGAPRPRRLQLSPRHGALRSRFYSRGIVLSEQPAPNGGTELTLMLSDTEYKHFCRTSAGAGRAIC